MNPYQRTDKKDLDWIFSMSIPEPNSGCWFWTGAWDRQGYGNTMLPGRRFIGVHRLAYQLAHGEVAEGLDIDHLCRVRCCVNPLHLEAVSHRENMLRGNTFSARFAAKTHCSKGHELTGDNVWAYGPDRHWRKCRTCNRVNQQEFRDKRKELRCE